MSLHISFDFDPESPQTIIAQGTDLDAAIQSCWDSYRELNTAIELIFNNIHLTLSQAESLADAEQKIKSEFQQKVIIADRGDFIETIKQSNQPLDFAKDNAAIIALISGKEARFFHPGQDRYISSKEREIPRPAERGFNGL